MKETTETWIVKGYETFAYFGQAGLKVELLAKEVGISKSSFYHHFADLEVFLERLLEHHLKRSKVIAEKERIATSINPELIQIFLEHKTDLLFNRQLRIHAHQPNYQATLVKANEISGTDFIKLWLKDTGLHISQQQAEGLFELALENFFLQINPENLTQAWLEAYFENLKRITKNIAKPLDGSG